MTTLLIVLAGIAAHVGIVALAYAVGKKIGWW